MRGEGDNCLDSINEMLAIAEPAEVALHLSHFKGHRDDRKWGSINKARDLIVDEGATVRM